MPPSVTILASGTLGDIRPLIALGKGLRAAGYAVTMATHAPFAALVQAHGLAFRQVDGNPSDLLLHDDAALTLDRGVLRGIAATARYIRAARPVYARMLDSALAACQGSAAIIVSLATCWGQHVAAALDVPCVWAPLQPISPTAGFPSPLLPGAPQLGASANRFSYAVIEAGIWLPWRAVLARWRRRTTGASRGSLNPFALARQSGAPVIYGVSTRVVPPPADWPAHHVAAGYWFLDDDEARLSAEEETFLAAGESPIYIGFGSMGGRRPVDDIALALAALKLVNRRGILIGVPEALRLAGGHAGILALRHASHQLLFPRVAVAVHHGGAGTTAAGLRAGIPTVTLPFGVDQYFWGARIAALGAGPPPIARQRTTPERLAAAIAAADTVEVRARAAELGSAIRAEDGVERAVAMISAYLG